MCGHADSQRKEVKTMRVKTQVKSGGPDIDIGSTIIA